MKRGASEAYVRGMAAGGFSPVSQFFRPPLDNPCRILYNKERKCRLRA